MWHPIENKKRNNNKSRAKYTKFDCLSSGKTIYTYGVISKRVKILDGKCNIGFLYIELLNKRLNVSLENNFRWYKQFSEECF